MFKFIIALVGYHYFGILGGVLGYILGAMADRYRAYGVGAINPINAALRQTVFLETVFILMGRVAKADGVVTQGEIAYVEQFIQKLGMLPQHRELAIALFKQGALPEFDAGPTMQRFLAVCGRTHDLTQMLIVYLIAMALSDGVVDTAETRLLAAIAQDLGLDQGAYQRLLDMVLNQSRFGTSQATTSTALDEAYRALGVSRENTDQEIKRAYRKLMSQYHPDKLTGQGLPADMIKIATEHAQEVQVAYDMIVKSRTPQP